MNVATTPAVDVELLVTRYYKEKDILQEDLINITFLIKYSRYRDLTEEEKLEFILLDRLIFLRQDVLKTIQQLVAKALPAPSTNKRVIYELGQNLVLVAYAYLHPYSIKAHRVRANSPPPMVLANTSRNPTSSLPMAG